MFSSLPRYWRERKGHYLLKATRCRDCGRSSHPLSNICRFCGSKNVEEINLVNEKARLLTWTLIYNPPSGYEHYKPLVIGIVETLETKTKVLTRLTDVQPEELKEGLLMEPVLRKISENGEHGIIHYAIAYRPILKG